MKVKFLKLKNWLLVTLMGVLGFTSCRSHKALVNQVEEPEPVPLSGELPEPKPRPRDEIRLMYGVPTMDYMIRGQVKDANGRPVGNIRVNMLERGMTVTDGQLQGDPERVKEWLEKTEITTDQEGRFTVRNSGLPTTEVRLLVRDVDGEENGSFKDSMIAVPVDSDNIDKTNAGGWNQGSFEKDVEVKLEAKQ